MARINLQRWQVAVGMSTEAMDCRINAERDRAMPGLKDKRARCRAASVIILWFTLGYPMPTFSGQVRSRTQLNSA
jgi:hypothetical protein